MNTTQKTQEEAGTVVTDCQAVTDWCHADAKSGHCHAPIINGTPLCHHSQDIMNTTQKTQEQMLKDLQNARNYSFEATMSDYSMASINRAAEQVEAATQALIDAGFEVPTW